jgi:hypothetical protein
MTSAPRSQAAFTSRLFDLLRRYQDVVEFSVECVRLFDGLPEVPAGSAIRQDLLDISGVELIESRKGARVTERTGYSTGRTYSGVRVGRVYVGGASGSRSSSTTVSRPAPDQLTLIDRGDVTIAAHRVSFVGRQFTRTTDYGKMVGFEREGRQIMIAPANASKVHILAFESAAEAFVVAAILTTALEHPARRLERAPGAMPDDAGPIASSIRIGVDLLAESVARQRDQIRDLIVAHAAAMGVPVRVFPLPSPPSVLADRIPDDPTVPFEPAPPGALTPRTSSRHNSIAVLMALFGGTIGLDRFYLGYATAGLIKFFSAGGFGYLWFRDVGLLLRGRLLDAEGLDLRTAAEVRALNP